MSMSPNNDNFIFLQNYIPPLFWEGKANIVGLLAAPTGGYVYQVGSLMALYTGGGSIGQYVNYVAIGSNGQGTCMGILSDQDLSEAVLTGGGSNANIQVGSDTSAVFVFNASLSVLTSGDIPTGMAELGARFYPDNGSGQAVWVL